MGSHAKPRTTGRKTAIGALTLGATLTGVGLMAAALDPATAVLSAEGTGSGGTTQLSGLSSPVALSLSPASDSITELSSAPLQSVSSLTNAVNGALGGGLQTAGSLAKTATSGTLDVSSKAPSQNAGYGSATMTAVRPISAVSPASGAGTSSRQAAQTRSAKPAQPTGLTGAATSTTASAVDNAASAALPMAQNLVSKVPVVSDLVQGSGVTSTATGLLQTATGTAAGTVNGSAGDPVTGALGGLPLVGSLLGGTGNGQSTLAVPNLSTLTGLR